MPASALHADRGARRRQIQSRTGTSGRAWAAWERTRRATAGWMAGARTARRGRASTSCWRSSKRSATKCLRLCCPRRTDSRRPSPWRASGWLPTSQRSRSSCARKSDCWSRRAATRRLRHRVPPRPSSRHCSMRAMPNWKLLGGKSVLWKTSATSSDEISLQQGRSSWIAICVPRLRQSLQRLCRRR